MPPSEARAALRAFWAWYIECHHTGVRSLRAILVGLAPEVEADLREAEEGVVTSRPVRAAGWLP